MEALHLSLKSSQGLIACQTIRTDLWAVGRMSELVRHFRCLLIMPRCLEISSKCSWFLEVGLRCPEIAPRCPEFAPRCPKICTKMSGIQFQMFLMCRSGSQMSGNCTKMYRKEVCLWEDSYGPVLLANQKAKFGACPRPERAVKLLKASCGDRKIKDHGLQGSHAGGAVLQDLDQDVLTGWLM